jgi:hypothetical protein
MNSSNHSHSSDEHRMQVSNKSPFMSYSIDPNRESKTKRYSNLSNSYGTIKFQKKKANMQQIMQSIEGGTDLDFNILELLDKKEVSILKRSHLGLPLLDPKSASLGIKFSSKPGF